MPLFSFLPPFVCNGGQQAFSAKSHTVNVLDFVDHMVSVLITELCRCSTKQSQAAQKQLSMALLQ